MLGTELTSGIISDGIILISKFLKKKPKVRKKFLIISVIIIVLDIVAIILNELFFNGNDNILIIFVILLICPFYVALLCIASFFISDSNITASEELDKLSEERNELNIKLQKETNVMDVIRINLNQLNEYYTINKVQAKRSYSLSIITITVGFIVLIVGIMLKFYGKIELNVTIITSLLAIISEFIGATSLLLYKESTKQIKLFFEKLSKLQNIMLAVELANKLNDNKKEKQIAKIISSLIEFKKQV